MLPVRERCQKCLKPKDRFEAARIKRGIHFFPNNCFTSDALWYLAYRIFLHFTSCVREGDDGEFDRIVSHKKINKYIKLLAPSFLNCLLSKFSSYIERTGRLLPVRTSSFACRTSLFCFFSHANWIGHQHRTHCVFFPFCIVCARVCRQNRFIKRNFVACQLVERSGAMIHCDFHGTHVLGLALHVEQRKELGRQCMYWKSKGRRALLACASQPKRQNKTANKENQNRQTW